MVRFVCWVVGAAIFFGLGYMKGYNNARIEGIELTKAAVRAASLKASAETTKNIRQAMVVDWSKVEKAVFLFNWANDAQHRWSNVDEVDANDRNQIRLGEVRLLERYCIFMQFEYIFWKCSEGTQSAINNLVILPDYWKSTVHDLKKFRAQVAAEYEEPDGLTGMSIVDDGTDWKTAKKLEAELKSRGLLVQPIAWSTSPWP